MGSPKKRHPQIMSPLLLHGVGVCLIYLGRERLVTCGGFCGVEVGDVCMYVLGVRLSCRKKEIKIVKSTVACAPFMSR
jgi:hypothetical protein